MNAKTTMLLCCALTLSAGLHASEQTSEQRAARKKRVQRLMTRQNINEPSITPITPIYFAIFLLTHVAAVPAVPVTTTLSTAAQLAASVDTKTNFPKARPKLSQHNNKNAGNSNQHHNKWQQFNKSNKGAVKRG